MAIVTIIIKKQRSFLFIALLLYVMRVGKQRPNVDVAPDIRLRSVRFHWRLQMNAMLGPRARRAGTRRARQGYYRAASLQAAQAARPMELVLGSQKLIVS
jgi:hypothetical protein